MLKCINVQMLKCINVQMHKCSNRPSINHPNNNNIRCAHVPGLLASVLEIHGGGMLLIQEKFLDEYEVICAQLMHLETEVGWLVVAVVVVVVVVVVGVVVVVVVVVIVVAFSLFYRLLPC